MDATLARRPIGHMLDGRYRVESHLAQGGSGDVLAGFIGGLLAQPGLQTDPGKALRYAVWQHGAAADSLLASRRNWTVEDLAEVIGSVSG